MNGSGNSERTARFKTTFSHEHCDVHFVGVWDTVSSVGIIRGKSFPGTDKFNDSVCYFRHALALDERRVKFLPEYVCGGESYPESGDGVRRVKEVWFAGCHSDIGGGNVKNDKLNNATIPVLWIANQARFAGLRLLPSRVGWDWEALSMTKPTESLNLFWRFVEILPIKRLTYMKAQDTTW